MQRKNTILNHKSQKSGMAMIMAIGVMVIMATIMALSLSLTTQTSKRTTDIYLYEQAVLLSQSASEYAMLKISQTNPCTLKNLNFSYGGDDPSDANQTTHIYDINISMKYVAHTSGNLNSCNSNAIKTPNLLLATTKTPDSDGIVVLDITVATKDGVSSEPIRYFRRSVNKM